MLHECCHWSWIIVDRRALTSDHWWLMSSLLLLQLMMMMMLMKICHWWIMWIIVVVKWSSGAELLIYRIIYWYRTARCHMFFFNDVYVWVSEWVSICVYFTASVDIHCLYNTCGVCWHNISVIALIPYIGHFSPKEIIFIIIMEMITIHNDVWQFYWGEWTMSNVGS